MNVTRKEIRGLIALAIVLSAVVGVLWLTRGHRGGSGAAQPVVIAGVADSLKANADSVAADSVATVRRKRRQQVSKKAESKKKAPAADRRSPLDNVNN